VLNRSENNNETCIAPQMNAHQHQKLKMSNFGTTHLDFPGFALNI